MLKKFFRALSQKGQALVVFALFTPLIFFAAGAALDLGWYYLNAARLQNMADSAIIASAKVLTKKDNEFSNYRYNYFLPKAPDGLELDHERKSLSGDLEAKKYISKNLETSGDWKDADSILDVFSDVNLTFEKKIFPTKDAEGYNILYYEITLTETPNHFFSFLGNVLDKQKISVKSAAKFTQIPDDDPDDSLFEQLESLKGDKVYDYWEVIQNEYKEEAKTLWEEIEAEAALTGEDKETVKARYIEQLAYTYMERGFNKTDATNKATADLNSDRSANKARERSVTTSGNWWLADLTTYRVENLTLRGIGGNNFNVNQMGFDDLFINFIQDVSFNFKNRDWDISEPLLGGMTIPGSFINCHVFDPKKNDNIKNFNLPSSGADPDNLLFSYRIFGLIGVEEERDKPKGTFPYKIRKNKEAPDPLFAKIESETIKWEPYYDENHSAWNTVRQIFINVNCANLNEAKDRPIIFFYDGPRKFDQDSHIRDPKPIILNLNADFRGAIYAPTTPVIIAGNHHSFTGLVIAKEFRKLKTEADFSGFKKVVRKDNGHEIYLKDENDIKFSETEEIPEKCIAVTYDGGEAGKFYYIERKDRDFSKKSEIFYFEKISIVYADSKYNPVHIPELFVDNNGDVAVSDEIIETADGQLLKDVGLSSATYDHFNLLRLKLSKKGSNKVFFTTEQSKNIY